jgi:hypothetical protein
VSFDYLANLRALKKLCSGMGGGNEKRGVLINEVREGKEFGIQ